MSRVKVCCSLTSAPRVKHHEPGWCMSCNHVPQTIIHEDHACMLMHVRACMLTCVLIYVYRHTHLTYTSTYHEPGWCVSCNHIPQTVVHIELSRCCSCLQRHYVHLPRRIQRICDRTLVAVRWLPKHQVGCRFTYSFVGCEHMFSKRRDRIYLSGSRFTTGVSRNRISGIAPRGA